jgi:biotin carboxyl carrier protein
MTEADGLVEVVSPVPGLVASIPVKVGDTVAEGDTVVVVNSMKMEIAVTADASGTVCEITVAEGEEIGAGSILAYLATS